jgi:hypothetical protein
MTSVRSSRAPGQCVKDSYRATCVLTPVRPEAKLPIPNALAKTESSLEKDETFLNISINIEQVIYQASSRRKRVAAYRLFAVFAVATANALHAPHGGQTRITKSRTNCFRSDA